MINCMLILFFVILQTISAYLWNPWEGYAMKSFVRGPSSVGQSFIIQQSDFYDAAYVGYFKFNTIDALKWYSLMRLQISVENYTFLHLYTRGTVPWLKINYDDSNYTYDFQAGPAFIVNTWYQFGFGYSQSAKTNYLIYQLQPYGLLYQYPVAHAYSLPPRITQFELCVCCQPYEYLFSNYDGSYSTIKMLTQQEKTSGIYKFFFNEHDMISTSLQRESYYDTAAVLTYARAHYTADLGLTCLTSTKFYYDGVCIEKTQCANVIYQQKTQFGIQNSVFWNSILNKCDTCTDNCLLCDSTAICQSCNDGYYLDTGANLCKKCSTGSFYNPNNQLCVSNCPTGYKPDPINQICVQNYNVFYHLLNPILLPRNFNQNEGFTLVDSTDLSVKSDQFVQCYLDNNSFGYYTFLGGQSVVNTYQLNKKILGLPKNYKKTIFFQAVIYNNGQQGDFNLMVNNNIITLASYNKVFSNQYLCTDNQLVNIFELTYIINDSSTNLDINIFTNKNGWGIRNFSMNITKCHSTCLDCTNDGNPWSCTSCDMQLTSVKINNNCACNKGQYAKFQDCYSSPCYACSNCPPNCNSCQDQTGKCTSCANGYSVQNGICVLNSSCSGYYTTDPGSSYCIRSKDFGLTQFINNRITANNDFWYYTGSGPATTSCYSRLFAPFLFSLYTARFTYSLQNYQLFHYEVEINLSATNIDQMALADYINYYINTNLVKKANYYTTSTTSFCYGAPGEVLVLEVLKQQTKSNQLVFLIESHLPASGYFTFNDVTINYTRCHASCSNCNDGNSCSACISNASQDATKGNFCYCNDGYYFAYDWSNSSGLCLQCNPFCKTCNGPNITDCLTCQESYKVVNNVCVNACNTNQFWDWTLHKCLDCSDCCASCTGTANNQCQSCYTDYMTLNSPVCQFNTDNSTCKSCNTNVVNSFCGGTQTNHNYCLTRGWVSFNSNTCVYCYTADANGYCGGSSQYNTVCNQYGYFYSSSTGTCLSCSQAVGTDCGDTSIRSLCISNKWIYESLSNCISCLITSNPLCCHSTCNTCNGQYEYNCLTCYGSQILFNGYCLDKCPNGYKLNPITNSCSLCPVFPGVAECNNCSADCNTCAAASITKCKTCYSSRILDTPTNRCVCKDLEDTRTTFYECSINNQAVLDIKLLNSGPKMTIDFGKLLQDLSGFASQEISNNVCKAIFDQTNLVKIGINSKCQVQFQMVNIDLDETATIMQGDFLNFLPNVLKFKLTSTVYIDTFLNNVVFQEAPSNTAVVFAYKQLENTCNDYKIVLDKILNDSSRGFKTITWTLMNPTSNSDDISIQQILSQASSQRQGSIVIPKGIIQINTQKNIKVEYLLKNTFSSSQQFLFQVKTYKAIVSTLQSDIIIPYYRFQSFIVSLSYTIQYCDAFGNQLNTNDPVDISITSPQTTLINLQLNNSAQKEVTFTVNPFTFGSDANNQINALLTISSDTSITSSQQLAFKTEPSTLIVKINGGNRKIDYKSSITLTSTTRDLDVQDETADQGITQTWTCSDPSDVTKPCLDQNGSAFVINSNNPTIPANTFNPYVVIKISLKGDKGLRSTTDLIVVLFIEFDLPILDVSLSLIDPFAQSVNLNEEIFTTLNYDTSVNPDILSFSSTIVYQNGVVGAIKFDYTKLKFQLWDYYSGYDRSDTSVTIRFSVFNPYYFMPSISIVNLKINFPPDGCLFSISPIPSAGNPVYSLQTVFTLSMSGCVDNNLPLAYQFFMYKSQSDKEYEIKNPTQVKRRQLNNQSPSSQLLTLLPAGDLVIMALVSDSLQAVYNTTLPLTVTNLNMVESQYTSYIDNALILSGKTNEQIISELSLISEDLSLRKDLTASLEINKRKIQIVDTLKTASLTLPTFSTFSTLSDKSISSLMQSGITFDATQETSQLNNLIASLAEDWTTVPYEQLSDIKKTQRNQQIYDYFDIIDKIVTNSKQSSTDIYNLQVDISTKIGLKMNYNSLPNEDPKYFQGAQLQIQSQQVTEKNLCKYLFCGDYQASDTQTGNKPIYNVAYKTHKINPFQNDPTYKNFTVYLDKYNDNKQPTVFPIVNPAITSTTTPSQNSPINQKDVQISFNGQQKEGLACFTKNSGSWTQSGCKLVYNKKGKQYTCFCESLGPTTIVDDLEQLINNKNLQTAFSSQGFENISNFTNFYKYIAFWLLVVKTIGFIALYLKGKSLDTRYNKAINGISSKIQQKSSNKVYPSNGLIDIKESNQNIIQKKTSLSPSQGGTQSKKEDQSVKNRKKRNLFNSLNNIQSNQAISVKQIKNNSSNLQQNYVTNDISPQNLQEDDDKLSIFLNQQDQIQPAISSDKQVKQEKQVKFQEQSSRIDIEKEENQLKEENVKNTEVIISQPDIEEIQAESQKKEMKNESNLNSQKEIAVNNPQNQKQKKQFTDLSEGEYSEKTKKFVQFNPIKQTIYFHNFFGIFLVYDNQMPRSLRFSCFYVRMIHSFAISIIFDQTYSPIQLVALSIANSILIMISLNLIGIVSKKLGKYAIVILLLALLGFYYYIILSIVSGQEPNKSNKSMVSYVIFFSFDILVVSFISALIQRQFAMFTIKKQKLQSCTQKLFELLHIQLILSSII